MSSESNHYGMLSFKIALCANLVSVLFNVVNDCDETYNYWEPLHFIVTQGRGGGFQTWEYSPVYGLRSYLYLWLIGWPAYLVAQFSWPMWLGFLLVRLHLAIWSAAAVTYLSIALARVFSASHQGKSFGLPLALWFCGFYSLSPGNFISATTFVPSGPATTLCQFMLAFWLTGHIFWAVGCVALMGIIIWPFAAFLGVPLATQLLFTHRLRTLVKYACTWAAILIPLTLIVDSYHFGRLVLAPFNIVRYNLFPNAHNVSGSASQLYGVEPAMFYVKNYILNHNIVIGLVCLFLIQTAVRLLLAGVCGLSSFSKSKVDSKPNQISLQLSLMCATPLVLWNLIFFVQQHKEERFLFPSYPCLSLGAALFAYWMVQRLIQLTRWLRFNRLVCITCTVLVIMLFLLMSASRIVSLTRWYSAPMFLIRHLPASKQLKGSLETSKPLLCMGRDWHYFPSRFLLPGGGQEWRVGYLPSNFRGQLPGEFAAVSYSKSGWIESTRTDGSRFNADNREEQDRFVRDGPAACDYIFDRDSSPGAREELYVADDNRWQSVSNRTILEPHSCGSARTDLSKHWIRKYPFLCHLFRAFYIPYLSEKINHPVTMHILKRTNVPV